MKKLSIAFILITLLCISFVSAGFNEHGSFEDGDGFSKQNGDTSGAVRGSVYRSTNQAHTGDYSYELRKYSVSTPVDETPSSAVDKFYGTDDLTGYDYLTFWIYIDAHTVVDGGNSILYIRDDTHKSNIAYYYLQDIPGYRQDKWFKVYIDISALSGSTTISFNSQFYRPSATPYSPDSSTLDGSSYHLIYIDDVELTNTGPNTIDVATSPPHYYSQEDTATITYTGEFNRIEVYILNSTDAVIDSYIYEDVEIPASPFNVDFINPIVGTTKISVFGYYGESLPEDYVFDQTTYTASLPPMVGDYYITYSTLPTVGAPIPYTLYSEEDNWNIGYITWYSYDWYTFPERYANISGTWYKYNHATHTYDESTDLADAREYIHTFNSVGLKEIRAVIQDLSGNTIDDVSIKFQVGDSSLYSPIHLTCYDITKGEFIRTLVPYTNLSILDYDTTIWTNITTTSGFYTYNAIQAHRIRIYYEKEGWTSLLDYVNTIADSPNKNQYLPLTPEYTAGEGLAVMRIFVEDYTNQSFIPSAYVYLDNKVNNSADTSGYTNTVGALWKVVNTNERYDYTISKQGYNSATGSFNISEDSYITVALVPLGVIPTATPTPTPIPTTLPTLTIPTTKPTIPIPTGATPDQKIWYQWSNLLGGEETLKWIIGVLVIFSFTVAAGFITKDGVGAGIGAGTGFVISIALQLIPVWTFFALLCVIGIVVAWKVVGDT